MSDDVRIDNSRRNMIYGFFCQVLVILFSFVNRQIFIELLGEEYLGINGLFANILTLLSLTEMGLGSTLLFFLYKPIREQDYERLQSLLLFCKRLFHLVALGVFIIGIVIVPLLPCIMDVNIEFDKIKWYYILYLVNSVLSYFSVNKSMVIEAHQKNYVINLYRTVSQIIQNVGQIFFLLIFRDYFMYLTIQIGCTVLYNVSITYTAYKMYPHIFKSKVKKIGQKDKKNIWEMLRATFVYKVGVIVMNNTDNILISTIVTTAAVGYYSNYKMVETVVSQFIGILIKAITASIGDLNAEDNKEHSLRTFRVLVFIFHVLIAFCSICLLLCLNNFVFLWIGKNYLLDMGVVFSTVFCFYVSNIITPVWIYRETMGLYRETKYLMLIASGINLILSVVLGRLIGLSGIIMATGLARILTTVWYEPRILFKKKLNENVNSYYLQQIRYIVQTGVCAVIAYLTTRYIPVSLPGLLCRVFIAFIVVMTIFILLNRKTAEYNYAKEMVKKSLQNINNNE